MNRYNIFNQVHKGLRAFLYETALALQQTDFSNRNEANAVFEQLSEILELFEKHANTEDNLLMPYLSEYEPAVVNVFEEEHDKDHALAQRLQELIFVYRQSIENSTREETGRSINLAFTEFLVFNLEHMAKEEKVLNKLLWRYYTDEQLHGITREILAHISPEDNTRFSRWMMRGLNNPEIITWLTNVKNSAPGFVFNGLLSVAQKELYEPRWLEIRQSVDSSQLAVAS
jgi:hemerythrin-like domain-containing protein